jgi:hypothetical protein
MDHDWYEEQVHESEEENEPVPFKNEMLRVEERAETLYFSIRDYLYETGEVNLLYYLNMDDCILLLYNPIYIQSVKSKD